MQGLGIKLNTQYTGRNVNGSGDTFSHSHLHLANILRRENIEDIVFLNDSACIICNRIALVFFSAAALLISSEALISWSLIISSSSDFLCLLSAHSSCRRFLFCPIASPCLKEESHENESLICF